MMGWAFSNQAWTYYTSRPDCTCGRGLLEIVSDGSNICKIDGGVNPHQQHTIHLHGLWVLLYIPALAQIAM